MRDFASFLDEIVEPAMKTAIRNGTLAGEGPASPSIPFGFVGAGAPGPSGDSRVEMAAAYLDLDAEWAGKKAGGETLPETAPDAIARELALHRIAEVKSLDRLRREFAFRNHPDRVRPEWRDRAMARMQIANRLIDEAKQRLAGRRG